MAQGFRVVAVSLLILTAVCVLGAAPVVADHTDTGSDEDDDDDDGVIIDFGGVVEKLSQLVDEVTTFTENFGRLLQENLRKVLWDPFFALGDAAAGAVVGLLAWMPDITIPEVLDIHKDVYFIALLLASPGFMVIGFVYMGYDLFGLSYRQVRPLIPRLVAALVFGAVAPWVLKYPVDLSEAVAYALGPETWDFSGLAAVSAELVLVAVVQAFILLALLVVLAISKVFVLVAAAAAPLIALLWAAPYAPLRGIAEKIIGTFWAVLLIGPLDVIVFRLSVALLSLDGFEAGSWVAGLAGTMLMLGIPYLLVSAGMSTAGPALAVAHGAVGKAARYRRPTNGSDVDGKDAYFAEMPYTLETREVERRSGGNRFDVDTILDRGDGGDDV